MLNKADGQGARDRLSTVVANSLDTRAKTQDLARQAYQSRTQFHRLFRTVVEETPAAMRRRLLLERAAYQLAHTGISVTDVALDANYGSLEAFTHAFRKAFRISPSLYRRMRDPHFHLPASNNIHFCAPGSIRTLFTPCPCHCGTTMRDLQRGVIQIGNTYNLVLPDNKVLRCSVTGLSE